MQSSVYRSILSLNNSSAGAYCGIAAVNDIVGGDIKISIKKLQEAIEIDSSYDRAYYYLAHAVTI